MKFSPTVKVKLLAENIYQFWAASTDSGGSIMISILRLRFRPSAVELL